MGIYIGQGTPMLSVPTGPGSEPVMSAAPFGVVPMPVPTTTAAPWGLTPPAAPPSVTGSVAPPQMPPQPMPPPPSWGQGPPVEYEQPSGFGAQWDKFTGDNANTLIGLGTALMAHGQNPMQTSMADVGQAALLGSVADTNKRDKATAEQEEKRRKNATIDWLIKYRGMTPEQAVATVEAGMVTEALKPAGGEATALQSDYNRAVSQGYTGSFIDYQKMVQEMGRPSEWGVSPIYGTDKNGNAVLIQLSKGGDVKMVQTPDGVTLSTGADKIDLGTSWGILDKRSGQLVGTIPKDVAGTASEQEQGAATGKAAFNLPSALASGERIVSEIDAVLQDPALGQATGPIQSRLPTLRGSTARAESRIAKIQGGAFLQAFESLKGAGAITEQEGKAAKEALTRLAATNMNDADYVAALQEFRAEVLKLMEIAKQKAGQQPAGQPAPANQQSDPLGIR